MRIIHLFKNVKNSSPFGECIIAALKDKSSSADTVYIGSGFFQEEEKPKTKSISNIQMGSAVTLLDAFRDSNIEDVHLIGSYIWKRDITFLAKHIKLIRPSAKVSWVHTNKFHAKIFILIKEGTPIFEIVGSSNMTKSAYGGCSNNRESDLMIYNEREFSDFQINKFVNNTISGQQNIITEFVYKDDSDINDGTSIADRMMSFLNLLKEEEQKAKKKKTY